MKIIDMLNKMVEIGTQFDGYYLLSSANVKNTSTGKTFMALKLTDVTGTIDGKLWDYAPETFHVTPDDAGKIVKIRGVVGEYNGTPQVTVNKIRLTMENDQYDISDIVPSAPMDANLVYKKITSIIETIQDSDYRFLCEEVLGNYGREIQRIPAGKAAHHAFLHGLLMHTYTMMSIADMIAPLYPFVNRDLLVAGTFLHDLGKVWEFLISELGLVTEYSTKGRLLGHLVIGAMVISDICQEIEVPEEKTLLIEHMLVSHHGQPEFGAAKEPQTAEAELLSHIDMLDAKMEIYREALDKLKPGEWSETNRYLGGHAVYKHYAQEGEVY